MPEYSRHPSKNASRIIQALLFGLVIVFLSYCLLFSPPAEHAIYPTCLAIAVLYPLSIWSWKTATDSLFDPYTLFLTAAVMFNGGLAFLEVAHLHDVGILDKFPPETIQESLLLVLLGLLAFHFGALFSTLSRPGCLEKRNGVHRIDARSLRIVGWTLLLISLVPALSRARDAAMTVISSGYFALYQRDAVSGLGATPRVLAYFLTPAALFLLAGSKGYRKGILVSGIIIATHSTIELLLGARSLALMPLIAYAWVWDRCIRPLSKRILLPVGLVILFVVFPTIKAVRNIAGMDRLSVTPFVEAFLSTQNPVVAILLEMGSSLITVVHTIQLVPAVRPFDMGEGYLYALFTIVPSLSGELHPTIVRGLAADWLVWTVAPSLAARGGGYGFSFIAEAYLNFGWAGTPVVLGLVGWLYAKMVLWAQRSSTPSKVAMVASFLSFFLLYARGESASIVRGLVWYAFVPYAFALALSRFGKGRHGLSRPNDTCNKSVGLGHSSSPE